MKDEMPKHGEELVAAVHCAKCGEAVEPNINHVCKLEKENEDENSNQK